MPKKPASVQVLGHRAIGLNVPGERFALDRVLAEKYERLGYLTILKGKVAAPPKPADLTGIDRDRITIAEKIARDNPAPRSESEED